MIDAQREEYAAALRRARVVPVVDEGYRGRGTRPGQPARGWSAGADPVCSIPAYALDPLTTRQT